MHRRLVAFSLFLFALTVLVAPVGTGATTLFGHPYAMLYDRESGSANFDTGVVFMWNDLNPINAYCGSARIPSLATGGFFAKESWDSLLQAMMNKKLTAIYTDAGPDTNVNDGSTGNLEAFVITIFGG